MIPLNTAGDMKVKFLNDKTKTFISALGGYLFCIDILKGQFFWKYKEKWAPLEGIPVKPVFDVPWFCEVYVKNDNIYITGKYMNKNMEWYASAVLIFNVKNRQLIKKVEYPNKRISISTIKDKIFVLDMDNKIIQCLKAGEEK
jgi:hypothetical protein